MPVFKTVDGLKAEVEVVEITDGTSNTLMFAEKLVFQTGETNSGTRLFVGNLSMNTSDFGPEVDDQVLVSFEHGQDTHPDFLWAPDWIL